MTLITRRQFVRQTAFSAGALYGFRLNLAMPTEGLEHSGERPPSIDPGAIQKLASKISGYVITPGASGYEPARQVNNHAYDRHPAVIVRCASPADVATALDFGRMQSLSVAVRCGGHSSAGFGVCEGGMMIDLAGMRRVEIDVQKRIVRAEAGCLVADVDRATERFGLATVMGGCPTVGIGGLTLGGGIGTLMPKYGAACDNIQSAEIVTVDSRQLEASQHSNSDLFWAIRGGGGNFGVATSYQYRLYPVTEVLAGALEYPLGGISELLRTYQKFTATAPDEIMLVATIVSSKQGPRFCQKELFDPAMKRIAAHPNDAEAYINLAQSMCPNLNAVIIGRPLPGGKPNCPDGPVQALNKYLELAPGGGLAPLAKKCLAAMGEPLGTPVAGRHRPPRHENLAVAASQPSSTTNNGGSGETPAAKNPSTHALPPGMMDGVYVGLRYQTATYHISPSVDYNFLIFKPDATVSQNFPQEGLDGANLAGVIRNQPAWSSVGQYRVKGNRVEIEWQRPVLDHWSVTRDDNGADPQADHYIPVCRCNGARLSGTYIYGKQGLQFSADGKFLDYGAIDSLLSGVGYPRPGRGGYRIQNFTLYLSYDDGRQLRRSFAAPAVEEAHGAFHWIMISGRLLYEQNYQRELYQRTPSGLNPSNRR
jgi:hypothetical protein